MLMQQVSVCNIKTFLVTIEEGVIRVEIEYRDHNGAKSRVICCSTF